ncbi:hypothetical protein Tco_0462635 [Tanacetum coccineum]
MANHKQNPPQQEQPFVATKQVSFSIPTGGIYGEVEWFPTIGYGEEVFAKGTLRKSLLPPMRRLLMTQIIHYLGGKTRGFDQITNKDAIILYSLENWINIDHANIFWEDIIIKLNKRHREKVVPYTRFLSLLMMHKMKEGYGDDKLVVLKAPKLSSNAKRVSQGTKPGAQTRHKKHSTSSKQPSMSSKEATKGGFSKPPTSFKTGDSKKRKESNSTMDSNLSQTLVSTHVDTRMHKEDQQATGGPASLGVIEPTLSSVVGMNEGTKNTLYDHLFIGTDPHVLADQTKYVSEGLETVLTQPRIGKGASSIARQVKEEEISNTIKLEDLSKLMSNMQPRFKDIDSPEDDPVIVVVDSDEDKEDEVLILQSQKHKLELEKNKAKAKAALLKAQPSFPNVGHLNELLVKSLQTEFLKILSAYDFSNSLPTELKDLPSKFNEPIEEIKGLKKQWELPADFLSLPVQVTSVQAKQKTLDALLGLLLNVTKALNKFAQVLDSASSKARDQSVPSAGQADTMPAEGDKKTNQATISQLF